MRRARATVEELQARIEELEQELTTARERIAELEQERVRSARRCLREICMMSA